MAKQIKSTDERQLKQVRNRCNELHDQCSTLAMYYLYVTQRHETGADTDEKMMTLTWLLNGINEDTEHLKKLLE
ncbi:MAG: hypothetical protein U9R15_01375 [Chloroflexota bacterium]|nr:hypothetical protein [Chloroflexota bacterium]